MKVDCCPNTECKSTNFEVDDDGDWVCEDCGTTFIEPGEKEEEDEDDGD
jgi:ribosomal protein L37AE/L43A